MDVLNLMRPEFANVTLQRVTLRRGHSYTCVAHTEAGKIRGTRFGGEFLMKMQLFAPAARLLEYHSSVCILVCCMNSFGKIMLMRSRRNRFADLPNMACSPRNPSILGWGDSLFESLDSRF